VAAVIATVLSKWEPLTSKCFSLSHNMGVCTLVLTVLLYV